MLIGVVPKSNCFQFRYIGGTFSNVRQDLVFSDTFSKWELQRVEKSAIRKQYATFHASFHASFYATFYATFYASF